MTAWTPRCAVCLDEAREQAAITVVNGQAVCRAHLRRVGDLQTSTGGSASLLAVQGAPR